MDKIACLLLVSDFIYFFTVDRKLIQHIKQIKWTGKLKADLFNVCFVPGRGPAALVVIHKHSPPKLGGGGGGEGKKRKRSTELKSRTENRNDKHH